MATPLVTAIVNKVGRTIYKNARGRFISKTDYLRELRRGPGGQFISAIKQAKSLTGGGLAQQLMDTIGEPMGGGNWVSRVRKSRERFQDLAAGNNELG